MGEEDVVEDLLSDFRGDGEEMGSWEGRVCGHIFTLVILVLRIAVILFDLVTEAACSDVASLWHVSTLEGDIEFPRVELVGGSLTYEFSKRAGRDYTCRI